MGTNKSTSEDVVSLFVEFEAQSTDALILRYSDDFNTLFPEDTLAGLSYLDKLYDWYRTSLRPKAERAGDKGKEVLRVLHLTDPELNDELLRDAVAFIIAWYFPHGERIAATVALVVVLRKLLRTSDTDGTP